MKKINGFTIFAVLHIGFIICICSISAYNSYCEFYHFKKKNPVIRSLSGILKPKVIQFYGRLSGCDAGYGFFAPNVRSSGIIMLENDSNKYTPQFKSLEAKLRFSTFENLVSDHILQDESTENKSTDSLINAYYDLLYKAIAVKLYNEKKCKNPSSVIGYDIYNAPSLAAYREGEKNASVERLYQLELTLKK